MAVLLAVCIPIPIHASHEALLAVTQPMAEPEGGHYTLRPVTFRVFMGAAQPGIEIFLGFQPGFLHQVNVDTVWNENRNEANTSGITVEIGSQAELGKWKSAIDSTQVLHDGSFRVRYFVDTLDVTLDVRRAVEHGESLIVKRTRMWELRAQEMREQGQPERVPYFEDLAKRVKPQIHHSVDALVEASVECTFDNAARSDNVPIHHLNVRILSSWDYRRFEGVQPVRPARKIEFPF